MRVTQQDIAKIANVSQATVSRVLAGDARVEDDIRQRVLVAMEENNYRPDVRARSLRNKQTNLIGLVLRRAEGSLQEDPFFSLFIAEIIDFLAETPYHLCVDVAKSKGSQEAVYDELLRSRRVDGLILIESEAKDRRIAKLSDEGFPFVLVGSPGDQRGVVSVDNDNVLAAEMATEHLVEQGYRRVGMIAGLKGVTVSEARIEGYKRGLWKADLPSFVWHADFGQRAAYLAGLQALQGDDRPDALVVLDDYMAMGVLAAARELRLSIPEDLGVVSFNDTSICEMLPGGLTSVNLNIHQIVSRACSRLLDILNENGHDATQRDIVPCSLSRRGSSKGPRSAAA